MTLLEMNEIRRRAGITEQKAMKVGPESLPKYLYHGTSIFHLVYILESNELFEGVHWGRPDEPHGPRLTKKPEIAQRFFSHATPDLGDESPGAILVLSTNKLSQDYELVEYVDVDVSGKQWDEDEEEVVPITETLKPLNKYLVSVVVKKQHAEIAMRDDILEFAIEWPYLEVDTVEEARHLVQTALTNPIINRPYH